MMVMKNTNQALPYSDEAEKAVLGAILINNNSINEVMEILSYEDFHNESHKKLFSSMIELDGNSKPIDVVTLSEYLKNNNNFLEDVGGSAYLTTLTSQVPSTVNVAHYAKIVKDKSILRNLLLTAMQIARDARSDSIETSNLLDDAEKKILDIAQNQIKQGFYSAKDLSAKALELVESARKESKLITGISTGFYDLDALTSGLMKSDLIIIAARPGLGKTSFCLNIASHAVLNNDLKVGIFSLEMTKDQLMLRLLSMKSKVSFTDIRRGSINEQKMELLFKSAEDYSKTHLFIDDSPALTVMEIRAKARRQKRDSGLDLLIVDYIQLMRGHNRSESREREIAMISGSLKSLAKELDLLVIGISQLNRQSETRSDRRPQLADLRESGAIEQDADVVLFIHRMDAYKKTSDDDEKDGKAEIIVAKQRNGPVGSVELAFLEKQGVPSFENFAPGYGNT